ncbi:MAG: N2,N2-dimethylguanosine tRNA methyltransferase [Cyanobacteriota bacterium]
MEQASQPRSEGAASFHVGQGFFNPGARPSRDLGVLLVRTIRRQRPPRVLDLMAGCGLRSLRYGLEGQVRCLWANDADPHRLPLLRTNLGVLAERCLLRQTTQTAHRLLADCLLRGEHFDLVDLDAFGSPHALVPLALEAVALEGCLYLASTDGRGPTGHDRRAAVRRLGASGRSHPASWEQALRLQIGVLARCAWSQGRGLEPVVSFSDGRTFRTAVRLRRHPRADEEAALGLLAICHGCGDQQVQSLLNLRGWRACACSPAGRSALAVSGPLWTGPLQHLPTLEAMAVEAAAVPMTLSREGGALLERLRGDRGWPARSWPHALLARQLGSPPPPLRAVVARLRQEGFLAVSSGVMPGQLRSDAPWPTILALAADLVKGPVK